MGSLVQAARPHTLVSSKFTASWNVILQEWIPNILHFAQTVKVQILHKLIEAVLFLSIIIRLAFVGAMPPYQPFSNSGKQMGRGLQFWFLFLTSLFSHSSLPHNSCQVKQLLLLFVFLSIKTQFHGLIQLFILNKHNKNENYWEKKKKLIMVYNFHPLHCWINSGSARIHWLYQISFIVILISEISSPSLSVMILVHK